MTNAVYTIIRLFKQWELGVQLTVMIWFQQQDIPKYTISALNCINFCFQLKRALFKEICLHVVNCQNTATKIIIPTLQLKLWSRNSIKMSEKTEQHLLCTCTFMLRPLCPLFTVGWLNWHLKVE